MMKEKKISQPLSLESVLVAYKTLRDNEAVSFEIPGDGVAKIESVVSTINSSYYGKVPYPTVEMQAAACLYYIIKAHAFVDGNKRVAVLTMKTFCKINRIDILLPLHMLDSLAIFVESFDVTDREDFIQTLAFVLFTKEG